MRQQTAYLSNWTIQEARESNASTMYSPNFPDSADCCPTVVGWRLLILSFRLCMESKMRKVMLRLKLYSYMVTIII